MVSQNEKEITNLELLESINRGFSRIEEKMATKEDLLEVRTDLKTFKQETRDSFEEVNKKIADLTETLEETTFNHENRIEVLERKVGLSAV